jgi:hypothetical protein
MVACPHCGAMNEKEERYCSKCSLDLKCSGAYGQERSGVSWRAVIILWAIVAGAGLVWWLIACIGASGLSDK